MHMHMVHVIKRMPDDHPTVSSILTGLWGQVGIIVGIVIATANYGQSAASGIFLILIGVTLTSFAGYTGYVTERFTNWHYTRKGTNYVVSGHSFTRWAEPVILFLAFLELLLMLWLLILINEIFASRR